MERVVAATNNQGKLREISRILDGLPVDLVSLSVFPDMPPLIEEGETFEENAFGKARIAAIHTGLVAVADDSGLVVDRLGGAPGVHSARYAGPDADDSANNSRLLDEMADLKGDERSAMFVCVACIHAPDGRHEFLRGECGGMILTSPRGSGGFGYDPLFLVPERNRTFAELPPDEKNMVSHRALAFAKVRDRLSLYLIGESEV